MTDEDFEAPASDEGDENPDNLIGEAVTPEHGLNIEEFEEDDME